MATKRTPAEIIAGAKARADAAVKRTAASPAAAKKAPAAEQLSLPMWPEAARGVPNVVLRSALFGVSSTRKTHKRRTVISTVDGYEIRFKGETFNQTDLDVWEMLLHLARLQPLGTKVEFAAHSFLKELGRGTGNSQHEQLKEELMRLITGGVEITWTKEKKAFAGTLVSSYFRDDETGRYVVKFNPEMTQLYETGHTLIDWTQRQALGKNSLAKWLHGQYATHANPLPYKVETLHRLSRSTAELKEFRRMLRTALAQLVEVGAIKSWSIDPKTDLVYVVNVPSQTQLKHLSKVKKP